MITTHTANGLHAENSEYLGATIFDVMNPNAEPTETADEIIERISNGLEGLNNGFI